jgi:phage terminase small subunit
MGILTNPRHELFAQELAKGKSADEAFVTAGYSKNRGNASRLKANESVLMRLSELQAQAARSTAITVESICAELDEANAVAKERGQASAMVSASALRAKLAGLLVEKVEVGNPGSFDKCESMEAIADEMIAQLIEGFYPVDEQDREGLIGLLTRQAGEVQEYIAAIKARPITAERCDPNLTTPWQELRPYSAPRRLTNGSHR